MLHFSLKSSCLPKDFLLYPAFVILQLDFVSTFLPFALHSNPLITYK